MYCFVILLLFNEMQMSVRRFSAIPHLRAFAAYAHILLFSSSKTIKSANGQIRRLYAYAASDSTHETST